MHFVPITSRYAQSILMLHRVRQLLVCQRAAQVSTLRAHVRELVATLESDTGGLPELARQTLLSIVRLIDDMSNQIHKIESELLACPPPAAGWRPPRHRLHHGECAGRRRWLRRQFTARLGLGPKQHSSGGKERIGGISKMGDRYPPLPTRRWRHRRRPLHQTQEDRR